MHTQVQHNMFSCMAEFNQLLVDLFKARFGLFFSFSLQALKGKKTNELAVSTTLYHHSSPVLASS